MTYPTAREMDEMEAAPPQTKAALEFIWAFTEWWEGLEDDDEVLQELGDPGEYMAMERAYSRWRAMR